jgi:hypothetical protein
MSIDLGNELFHTFLVIMLTATTFWESNLAVIIKISTAPILWPSQLFLWRLPMGGASYYYVRTCSHSVCTQNDTCTRFGHDTCFGALANMTQKSACHCPLCPFPLGNPRPPYWQELQTSHVDRPSQQTEQSLIWVILTVESLAVRKTPGNLRCHGAMSTVTVHPHVWSREEEQPPLGEQLNYLIVVLILSRHM